MPSFITGIRIVDSKISAKAISIIRKYTNCSISDIKTKVLAHEYVYQCDLSDTINLLNLKKCFNELKANDVNAEIIETLNSIERKSNLELLKNHISTNIDIAAETDELCDLISKPRIHP